MAHVFCEHGSPIDKLAYDLKSKAPAEQQGVLFHVWSNDLANYSHKSLLIGSTWITSGLPTTREYQVAVRIESQNATTSIAAAPYDY